MIVLLQPRMSCRVSYIVRAILHEIVDPDKVSIRDNKTYCAILFEDKP